MAAGGAAPVPSTLTRTAAVSVSRQGHGPLAEIEFWRERNATLSALHEQTKLPVVRKVLEVIKESDSLLVANLQPVLTDLFKLHMEASDNVRFLSTVERHFKVRPLPWGPRARTLPRRHRSRGCATTWRRGSVH